MNRSVARPNAPNAFTLIELIASIGIIAILSAILFPTFAHARSKDAETVCISNQRQIAFGASMYALDNDETLPEVADRSGRRWIDRIAAYVQDGHIRRCPADEGFTPGGPRHSSYGVNAYLAHGIPMSKVVAPSHTIYAAEMSPDTSRDVFHPMCWNWNVHNVWAWLHGEPTELAWDRHSGGSNYAFLDGHAHWMMFESTYDPPQVNNYLPGR